jgi:hypothetical protein
MAQYFAKLENGAFLSGIFTVKWSHRLIARNGASYYRLNTIRLACLDSHWSDHEQCIKTAFGGYAEQSIFPCIGVTFLDNQTVF